MKQVLQDLGKGDTLLVDVPAPKNIRGNLLVKTANSVISSGTERMLVDFGKANYIQKARQQPDKVKMVLNKVKTDGLAPTLEAVRSKLDNPMPLGYCNVGVVVDSAVEGFEVGDRVVSNGAHSELVRVPERLCAKVPEEVSNESAAFTVLGSIALQGVRLSEPTIGETVVVLGLGLIGLITVQILKANGCRVMGVDYDQAKCDLAREFGAEAVNLSNGEDPVAVAQQFSRGRGVDAVLITAATKSNEPVSQAANMLRKRGRIVLVGVVGLELSRAEFYEKEISFQVSCSYGPGRYDPEYEEKGNDYPVGFVRWTEQRNFEAVLDLMKSGSLNIEPLITHRYEFENVVSAYEELNNPRALGVLLNYKSTEEHMAKDIIELPRSQDHAEGSKVVCGFLGGGNYAGRILIPCFKEQGVGLDTIATSGGVSAVHQAKKGGFKRATSDERAVLDNEAINTVVIATRHDLHADQVCAALEKNKNVFVEKPLAITQEGLNAVEEAYNSIEGRKPILMVGFNRRFSPQVQKMKALLSKSRTPKCLIFTVNAGHIPKDHWTQEPEVGGGRIIGECCHFIDLLRYLVGHRISGYQTSVIGDDPGIEIRNDKVTINLTFEDGSIGTIHYFSNGGKSFQKERLEVFCNDSVLQLNNFRKLKGYGWDGFNRMNLLSQDKGQKHCVKAFVDSIKKGEAAPIDFEELIEISKISIEISESVLS